MARPRVGIVIPALNEAASIGAVVAQAIRFGIAIVVDDGSQDETGSVATSVGADVVRHECNRGYDRAIDSGFARADALDCDIVVTMDADGQHNPLSLEHFITAIAEGADIVVGVRDRRQRFAEHAFGWISRRLWGIEDPLCGMKAYRIDTYRRLGHFDSYGSIGTELAIYAASQGYKFAQLPLRTRDRIGAPRFGRLLRANWLILRALAIALTRSRRSRIERHV
jgi:glycosyltransferase involved in cell wall biosynthesis